MTNNMMPVDAPAEMLLDRLAHLAANAAEASSRMSGGEEAKIAREELGQVRRSIEIRRLLWNARTIAITGLQGAGKSTFTLALLGLEEKLRGFVPISHVRDEKISILIQEHDRPEVIGGVMKLSPSDGGTRGIITEYLDPAAFVDAVRNPQPEFLLMTLRVPHVLFGDKEQGLLLTPGIEDPNDPWSLQAREAVYASKQLVLVADVHHIAGGRRERLVELAKSFNGCNFTPVLTHCDTIDGETQNKVCEEFAKCLGLPEHGKDVVRFGLGKANAPTWGPLSREDAIQLIAQKTGTPAAYREVQNSRMRELVEDDGPLARAIFKLESLSENALNGATKEDRGLVKILEVFHEKRKKARGRLQNAMRTSIPTNDAIRKVEEVIDRRGYWPKLKAWVCGFDLKEKHWIEDAVLKAWNSQEPANAVSKSFSAVADGFFALNPNDLNRASATSVQLPDVYSVLMIDGSSAPHHRSDAQHVPQEGVKFRQVAEFLPYWGMALVGAGAQLQADGLAFPTDRPRQLDAEFLAKTLANLKQSSEFSKQFVATTVGTVVGVDAADGNASSISGVLSKAGVTMSATTSAVLGGALAVGAIAVVAASIKRQLGAMDIEMANIARQLITAHQNALLQAGLDRFDHVMEQLEDALAAALRRRSGQDQRFNSAMTCRFATADVDLARREVLARVEARRYGTV